MKSGTLPSGLTYAVSRSNSAVGYCSITIKAGTRYEDGFPAGTAHFVEHALFRGTRKKTAGTINSYLDRLGGELNAYTTKEEIVLHASVLKEDLRRAASLLFELATEPVFPERGIETERGIVLDEILSYKDNPVEEVYDRFEGALFKDHPLGTPILGTTSSVKRITRAHLARFRDLLFTPERMTLSLVADMDESALESLAEKLSGRFFPEGACGQVSSSGTSLTGLSFPSKPRPLDGLGNGAPENPRIFGVSRPRAAKPPEDTCPSGSNNRVIPFRKVFDKRHHEANVVMGNLAPGLYDGKERIVTALLCNILGGPASNSLLGKSLRESKGLVYSIECSYTQYIEAGIVAITFGCDRVNLEKCRSAVDSILGKIRTAPLSERTLKAYRKQFLAQMAVSSDNGEARCLSMGKSMSSFGKVLSSKETREMVEAVSADDLLRVAGRIFDPEEISVIEYL